MINCKIRNDHINFEMPVFLETDTVAMLSNPDSSLPDIRKELGLVDDAVNWIKQESDLFNVFVSLESFLNHSAENLLTRYLLMMIMDDFSSRTKKVLCNKKLKREDFIKKFRKLQKFYMFKGIPNPMSPDVLSAFVCYETHIQKGSTDITIPVELIPLLIPIESAIPEQPPEGFDPTIPYEDDTFTPEQKRFFDKFPFFRKKEK